MFTHIFKNSLKVLFKNKMLVFWTFAFPIILGTLFNMAFSNIEKEELFTVVPLGIVNDDNYKNNHVYTTTFDYLSSNENENKIFDIKYGSIEEMDKLLDDEDISGYIYSD